MNWILLGEHRIRLDQVTRYETSNGWLRLRRSDGSDILFIEDPDGALLAKIDAACRVMEPTITPQAFADNILAHQAPPSAETASHPHAAHQWVFSDQWRWACTCGFRSTGSEAAQRHERRMTA